ncbi:hypothetical protein [Staphylococcus caledonicus]|uniref:hypothetical protein n=1 Tax=Staphylococcus caledonicus TaxID=2741333 RepID=UPI0018E47328|nr:hypothetical protein [Staphylococcus caledonicus]MBI5972212.1 hypothetical protein [Staphylococcus caledonicus]
MTLIISNVVMFVVWLFVMYKWIKAEKKNESLEDGCYHLEKDKISLDKKLVELEKHITNLETKKTQEVDNMGSYIVEVNNGIYLVKEQCDAYEYFKKYKVLPPSGFLTFTRDAFKATNYLDLEAARKYAKQCGGRVLQHKPNLEVVE